MKKLYTNKETNMTYFYRVQQLGTDKGLWYDRDGEFNNRITKDFKFLRAHTLPMEYDEEIGKGWLSAVKNLEDLDPWFNTGEMLALQKQDIFIFAYEVDEGDYRWYEHYKHWLIFAESKPVMKIEVISGLP